MEMYEDVEFLLDDFEEKEMYVRGIFLYIMQLHSLNTDAYDMGCRTSYLDEMGMQFNGMRTEQLAIWIIDEREKCISRILYLLDQLDLKIYCRQDLAQFYDIRNVSEDDINTILHQIKNGRKRVKKSPAVDFMVPHQTNEKSSEDKICIDKDDTEDGDTQNEKKVIDVKSNDTRESSSATIIRAAINQYQKGFMTLGFSILKTNVAMAKEI